MDRKKIQFSKYLAAFAITTLIFFAGLGIGSHFNAQKLEYLDELEQNIKLDTMGTEVQYLLMAESPCTYVNSTQMGIELGSLGSKLAFMESQLGEDNKRVMNLKEYYSLLELRHWLFLNKAKRECNMTFDLVLYFYSNEKGDCPECEKQGYVLSYVHKKYPKFNIYSFDINIDNPALNTLRERYDIISTPTLVINNDVHLGFTSKDKIMEELNLSSS